MTSAPTETHDAALAAALARIGEMLALEPDEASLESVQANFGHYEGLPPKVELLSDGRTGRLLEPIAYYQADGTDWPAPAGARLDGASIPRVFWSLIGGPFEGKYRDASIIHDYYCDVALRSWRETHSMFHDAMRCSGVGKAKAAVMFYAVYRFGPRWADPALESLPPADAPPLSDADAEALLLDAEAIVQHGLNVTEITALADARDAAAAAVTLESVEAAGSSSASLLVVPGGSGKPDDVAAVTSHALALPPYVIDLFIRKGIRIVACRNSVTDFERDLAGKIPRGWERTGLTWDSVPGAYFPDRKRVVIGTITDASGGRVVPDKTSRMHGSDDLVVHESLHAYDFGLNHAPLRDPRYVTARNADLLGLTDYERQAGDAGQEETFAETGAQHCVSPSTLAGRCPRLAAYWHDMPFSNEAVLEGLQAVDDAPEPVGLASREAGGAIALDLRATDDAGAIGHAWIDLQPDTPLHAALERELFPIDALEATGSSERRTAAFFG